MLLGYLKKTIKFYIFKYKYPEASIGFGSSIDKNSSIKKDFTIGTNSYISNSNIENNVNISSSCSISFSQIANNVKIDNNVNLCEVTVGRFSYISSHTTASQVAVGSFCSIGPQCLIGYGEHPTNFVSTSPVFFSTLKQCGTSFSNINLFKERKKITIGHDVWLGARVFIKDGVTIGNGAIVGAGAVVVKNVPDYAIVGGVPAKLIRFRFSHELIQKLQIIRWWNLSEEYLQEAQSLIAQPNIQMFISWHEKNMPFDLVIKGHN